PCAYSLFLSWPRAHLYLHSFPTRRSSDLPSAISPPLINATNLPALASSNICSRISTISLLASPGVTHPGNATMFLSLIYASSSRSEEHTSELQSRENLVCRLLLEKKKNNA